MRSYFPFLLMLFIYGCATTPEGRATAGTDTVPKALRLDFKSGEDLVSTVGRLMEEAPEAF